MMRKITEQTIREIADKRKRASAPDRAASWRMSSLLQTFNSPTRHRDELLRYFPIAVVASIDGYFRTRMADLIDAGDPFRSNAVSKYPDIKLDIEMARALATKEISLGELITYRVSISSFSALIEFVRNVTGESGFPEDLAKVKHLGIGESTSRTIMTDPEATWRHLNEVFSLRHVLCHELAADLIIDEENTRLLLLSSQDFVRASAAWIDDLMAEHFPIRRGAKARQTKTKISEARKHIDELINEIRNRAAPYPELRAAAEALIKFEISTSSYISAMKETWVEILGENTTPVAEHHTQVEELNVLKVCLSILVSMIVDLYIHRSHLSENFDLVSLLKDVPSSTQ